MGQKEIRLFDDSVIKFTVRQGLENERFPYEDEQSDWFYKNGSLDYETVTDRSGCLHSGELGWTRDTHRLFVGNISDKNEKNNNTQLTPGGVLTGNKYLGFIDTRSAEKDGEAQNVEDVLTAKEYKTYNFTNNADLIYTEDGKWPKIPYYNVKYDAYDGDYIYDIHRNALILFDHNIKQYEGNYISEIGGKIKTPTGPLYTTIPADEDNAKKTVYDHTDQMYGDGYVLLYNVIPDGDTLTFINKKYTSDGSLDPNTNNTNNRYSQNVIKLNKIPAELISANLDSEYFVFSDMGESSKITLTENIREVLSDMKGFNERITNNTVKISDIDAKIGNTETTDTISYKVFQLEETIKSLSSRIIDLEETIKNLTNTDGVGDGVGSGTEGSGYDYESIMSIAECNTDVEPAVLLSDDGKTITVAQSDITFITYDDDGNIIEEVTEKYPNDGYYLFIKESSSPDYSLEITYNNTNINVPPSTTIDNQYISGNYRILGATNGDELTPFEPDKPLIVSASEKLEGYWVWTIG